MTTPSPDRLTEMLEDLYDLDRDELRRLAWEALLISDGPDRIIGEVKGPVQANLVENGEAINVHYTTSWFIICNPTEE